MAEKLARMYGTEEDKVNCPFYFKIGACRYGDKCLRIHNKPPYSQTLLIKNMYTNLPVELALASGNQVSEEEAIEAEKHLEKFYEDIFFEFANFGEVEDVIVCDNIGDHLLGAVYVKFVHEEDAMKCMEGIRNRYYEQKLIIPEYSPVTDFSNAKCKQFIENQCKRGGFCNYMHLKPINSKFKRRLYKEMYEEHPEYKRSRRSRSRKRSKSRKRDKKSKHRSSRSRSHKKDKKKKKHRHRSHSSSKSKSQVRSNMNSEERRALIAQWNDDGDDNQQQQNQEQKQDDMAHLKGLDFNALAIEQAKLEQQLEQQKQQLYMQQQQQQQQQQLQDQQQFQQQ